MPRYMTAVAKAHQETRRFYQCTWRPSSLPVNTGFILGQNITRLDRPSRWANQTGPVSRPRPTGQTKLHSLWRNKFNLE